MKLIRQGSLILFILTLLSACSSTTTRFFYWSPSRPDYHQGEAKGWDIGEVAVIDSRPFDWIGYTRDSKGNIKPLFVSQNMEALLWEIIVDEFEDNYYTITNKPTDPLIEIEILSLEAAPVRGDYGICLARVELLLRRYNREGKTRFKNPKGFLDGTTEFFAGATEEILVKFDAGQAASTLKLALQKVIGKILASHIMHNHLLIGKIRVKNPIYQSSPHQSGRKRKQWRKSRIER